MLIHLPPHIEQLIIHQAQKEQLSVSELVANWAIQAQKESNPMIDAVMRLEPSESFKTVDAVALQRAWRDEWS